MRKVLHSIFIVALLTVPSLSHGAEREQIDALRPKVLIEHDFEDATVELPQGMALASKAGDHGLSSQQLVISAGKTRWETELVPMSEALVTSVQVDFTAIAGPQGFDRADHIRMYVDYGSGDEALSDLLHVRATTTQERKFDFNGLSANYHVIGSSPNQVTELSGYMPVGELVRYEGTRWENGKRIQFGVLRQPRKLKIVIEAKLTYPGSYFAVDNLRALEETVQVKGYDPESFAPKPTPRQFVIDDSQFDANTPSITFSMDYRPEDLTVDLRSMAPDDLCLGHVFPKPETGLLPITLSGVSETESGYLKASFTMNRPPDDWNSVKPFVFSGTHVLETPLGSWERLSRYPRLFLCDANGLEPIDAAKPHGEWVNFAEVGVVMGQNAPDEILLQDFYGRSITAGFQPLTELTGSLESFRFRVLYESKNAPFEMTHFESDHLVMESFGFNPRTELRPEMVSIDSRANAHWVQIDYQLAKPSEGWPMGFFPTLLNNSIRDAEGSLAGERSLGTVGRDVADDIQLQMIRGRLVEGDPDKHRVSLLVKLHPDYYDDGLSKSLSGPTTSMQRGWFYYYLLFGDPGSVSTVGRVVSYIQVGYESEFSILNFNIDRPADGWPTGEIPIAIQTPGLRSPNSLVSGGVITVAGCPEETNLDLDGDGMSNAEEQIAGTDPNEAMSNLRVKSLDAHGDRHVMTWSSVPGKSYQVQFSNDLKTWTTISSPTESSDAHQATYEDSHAGRQQQPTGYYRIKLTNGR